MDWSETQAKKGSAGEQDTVSQLQAGNNQGSEIVLGIILFFHFVLFGLLFRPPCILQPFGVRTSHFPWNLQHFDVQTVFCDEGSFHGLFWFVLGFIFWFCVGLVFVDGWFCFRVGLGLIWGGLGLV